MSSLTVVMPALNEEANLEAAVAETTAAVSRFFSDWEILIFNDGSTDRTGQIADQLQARDPKVRAIHHQTPRNLGGCYKEGVELATKEFIIMIPGDNECGRDVQEAVYPYAGASDIIIPYTSNSHVRPFGRQVLSGAFVSLLNLLSKQNLRYYNGAVLHKTHVIRSYPIQTDSFGYQAEALVMLLRRGHSFKEVPTEINYRPHGRSKALRVKNLVGTARFLLDVAARTRLADRG